MKISCDREQLLHAFQTVATVAPTRSPKPILQNVKLDATEDGVTLTATDLEVGIRHAVAASTSRPPGSVVLRSTRFGTILRENTDQTLHIESDGQGATIRGERSKFQLPAENPAEFPPVADFAETNFFEVPARLLRELIRRTVFATDNETSRYALGGVKLEFDGGNGHRGRHRRPPAGQDERAHRHPRHGRRNTQQNTIVPTRAMQLIERAIAPSDAELQMAIRGNEFLVHSPRATISARLLGRPLPRLAEGVPRGGRGPADRAVRRPHARGGAAGGDRHQRGEPRHRLHVRRRLAGARRQGGRRRPVARRDCRSATTARRSRSRSTRGS